VQIASSDKDVSPLFSSTGSSAVIFEFIQSTNFLCDIQLPAIVAYGSANYLKTDASKQVDGCAANHLHDRTLADVTEFRDDDHGDFMPLIPAK